jgi:gamma-glutamylaminecyclotransferase
MIMVFVYGTLMRNCYNHGYVKDQKYLGEAVLPGYALYDVGSYLGIVPDEKERVLGELYEINQQCLEQLDILEDNGWLYSRRPVQLWQDGNRIEAEVYVWNGKVREEDKVEIFFQPWSRRRRQQANIYEYPAGTGSSNR